MYNNTRETVAINKNFGIIVILQNSMRVNLKKNINWKVNCCWWESFSIGKIFP